MSKFINLLPEEEKIRKISSFYNAFSDTTRIKILFLILKERLCVTEIAKVLNVSQPAISYQLRILKQLNIVTNKKEGKSIFYEISDEYIKELLSISLAKLS